MAIVEITLLGTPLIRVDGELVTVERRKSLAIIAYLAATGLRHRRDEIGTLFWSDVDQSRALANLRQSLTDIRRVLGNDDMFDINRSTIMMQAHDDLFVDVRAFNHSLAEYKKSGKVTDLEAAVQHYRGEFLTGFSLSDAATFDDWQAIEAERYRRECLDGLDKIARYYQDERDFDLAIHYGLQALKFNRLDEGTHRLLMRLYAESRQLSEARKQYQLCVQLLHDELGIEPQPATQKLFEDLERLEVRPEDTDPLLKMRKIYSSYPPRPPLLIGRETVLQDIKARVGVYGESITPRLIIQGTLGSGKSAILAQLAHDAEIKARFPDGVLWVTLGDKPDIDAKLSSWAVVFSLSHSQLTHGEINTHLRTVAQSMKLLIVIDDVYQAGHVFPFDVVGDHSAALITTRFPRVAQQLAPTPSMIYEIPPLSSVAGLELMTKLTPTVVERHPDATQALVDYYGGLPLALQVAGKYLQHELSMGWSLTDVLDELQTGYALLKGTVPLDVLRRRDNQNMSLAELLYLALGSVDTELWGPLEVLVKQYQAQIISVDDVKTLWGADTRETVRALINSGLLTVVGEGRFQIPVLFAKYCEANANAQR